MIPQRYDALGGYVELSNGDLILYTDAEKWVGKEVAILTDKLQEAQQNYDTAFGEWHRCIKEIAIIQNEKELAEEHLRLDTITWEKALKKRDKEIAALKTFIKEKLHLKYPHGANGCCCLFDDDENQIQWCSVHKALRDDVAALKEELESYAWKISPAMVQMKIDELNRQIAALTEKVNQLVIANP